MIKFKINIGQRDQVSFNSLLGGRPNRYSSIHRFIREDKIAKDWGGVMPFDEGRAFVEIE